MTDQTTEIRKEFKLRSSPPFPSSNQAPHLKIKHKKKKVKLAVLQFYKVDDSGKVQRLRKECPNAECGAGTFMASHFDRHYCGKCGLTYVYQKAGGD
ncbi:hypothetical protein CUMW_085520 [Citrus unshiu]|nr:hypothetical protein CUMW_085520 [Citrus unshiu]